MRAWLGVFLNLINHTSHRNINSGNTLQWHVQYCIHNERKNRKWLRLCGVNQVKLSRNIFLRSYPCPMSIVESLSKISYWVSKLYFWQKNSTMIKTIFEQRQKYKSHKLFLNVKKKKKWKIEVKTTTAIVIKLSLQYSPLSEVEAATGGIL